MIGMGWDLRLRQRDAVLCGSRTHVCFLINVAMMTATAVMAAVMMVMGRARTSAASVMFLRCSRTHVAVNYASTTRTGTFSVP